MARNAPLPPNVSIQPWSTDFRRVCVSDIGVVRIFCEDRGVKNHIVMIACLCMGGMEKSEGALVSGGADFRGN